MSRTTFSVFLVLCCTVFSVHAVEVATSSTIPPYAIASEDGGLHVSILRAALAERGIPTTFSYVSNKRLLYVQKAHRADVVTHVKKVEGDGWFYTAVPIESFLNSAISISSREVIVNSISDLSLLRVAAWQNARFYLGSEFQMVASSNERYAEFAGHMPSLMLVENRVDAVISEPNVFMFYLHKGLKGRKFGQNRLTFSPIFSSPNLYWWGFRNEELRDAFEAGLAELYKKGVIDQIFDHYSELYELIRDPMWSMDCHYGRIASRCQ